MNVTHRHNHRAVVQQVTHGATHIVAWLVALLLLLNTLYFVFSASAPVVRDDDWYFLDVFLRKVIDGSLTLGDFFVRRAGADHSQPLFKLVLLLEWRYFNLDLAVGAVIGVLAAATCAMIFYRIILAEQHTGRSDACRYLAWAAICAVLFTLNADAGMWTWPLVSLENVTSLIILLFIAVVWHAHQSQRYVLLTFATLFLAISSDDSALIAVVAAVMALLLAQHSDPAQRRPSIWKILAVMGVCMMLVRVGYVYAPVVGGAPSAPMTSHLKQLLERFQDKGWWMWAVLPLTLPVFYRSPLHFLDAETWRVVQMTMAAALLAAHLWFWWTAFRRKYNRVVFVAVCLMLVSYGWLAGIILGRVAVLGNDYLNQPRYVLLYSGHLIALLLMWTGSPASVLQPSTRRRVIGAWVLAVGCLALLLGQIPLSIQAWRARPYLGAYYAKMAYQINELTKHPEHAMSCVPELPVCGWPPEKRRELTQLLSQNRLNVFSPQMQQRHTYLPLLAQLPAESPSSSASNVGAQPAQALKANAVSAAAGAVMGVINIIPVTIATCDPGVVATVYWDAQAAQATTTATEIWVGSNSADLKLFAAGGTKGQVKTGPWTRPGMHFVLKNKEDGKVLGDVTVGGPSCLR